jgi:hypothetical protein
MRQVSNGLRPRIGLKVIGSWCIEGELAAECAGLLGEGLIDDGSVDVDFGHDALLIG